jgi:23S rRNA (cytidine1920-2'-O)/16S rRNA (cytidine1409-2'-O)-methyltransferase
VVVADLSFISLQKVVPHLVSLFPAADLVLLVKPQFEVGKGKTRGGIVHYDVDREEALTRVVEVCRAEGFTQVSSTPSPIEGKKGNVEYLVYSSRRETAG